MVLDPPLPFVAEKIETQAVMFEVGELEQAGTELPPLIVFQQAFEDRILHLLAMVEAGLGGTTEPTHLQGLRASEHSCGHERAMLGEGEGGEAPAATTLGGTGRNLRPQVSCLFAGKLKAEIIGKTVGIPPNRLVEALGQNAVKRSQIAIEDDALAANGMNRRELGVGHGVLRLN